MTADFTPASKEILKAAAASKVELARTCLEILRSEQRAQSMNRTHHVALSIVANHVVTERDLASVGFVGYMHQGVKNGKPAHVDYFNGAVERALVALIRKAEALKQSPQQKKLMF